MSLLFVLILLYYIRLSIGDGFKRLALLLLLWLFILSYNKIEVSSNIYSFCTKIGKGTVFFLLKILLFILLLVFLLELNF